MSHSALINSSPYHILSTPHLALITFYPRYSLPLSHFVLITSCPKHILSLSNLALITSCHYLILPLTYLALNTYCPNNILPLSYPALIIACLITSCPYHILLPCPYRILYLSLVCPCCILPLTYLAIITSCPYHVLPLLHPALITSCPCNILPLSHVVLTTSCPYKILPFSHPAPRREVVSYWRKYVHEVLVNRLGGLSQPRKCVVTLTDRPDMTLDVYRRRKTTMQQQHPALITSCSYTSCPQHQMGNAIAHDKQSKTRQAKTKMSDHIQSMATRVGRKNPQKLTQLS